MTGETPLARAARAVLLAAAGVVVALSVSSLAQSRRSPPPEGVPALAARAAPAFALAVALALCARARPSRRIGFALAAASAALAAYAAEISLAWSADGPSPRVQAIRALRAQGVPALPAATPRYLMMRPEALLRFGARAPLVPLGSPSHRVIVDCREAGEWMVYRTDEHGFHNPPGLWADGPPDLLLLGDSFTNGACVESGHTLPGRLRERYPRVLNLAANGNGPLLMLAGLREALAVVRPRRVLWVYFAGNDLLDLSVEAHQPALVRYLDRGLRPDLLQRQAEVDAALSRFLEDGLARTSWWQREGAWGNLLLLRTLRARVAQLSERGRPRRPGVDFDTTEDEYAFFARVLGEARQAAEAAGGRLWFVYLPSHPELYGAGEGRSLAEARRARVLDIVRGARLPLADVHPAFARAAAAPALFACERCHYTEDGYALAASAVAQALSGEPASPPVGEGPR
jgi:hypothetical protein